MALLRNREVKVLRVAHEIDGSTFEVEYLDGENEFAKLHELSFTKDEYEQHARPHLPEVKILEDKAAKKK